MQTPPYPARPAMMKRQSSQSSQSSKQAITSPASVDLQPGAGPLRHHVKPRHAKIVLPRNQGSGRNLAKLNRQTHAQADDVRKHSRQRSHEGDTEIRLPGSLDESESAITKPVMRRNMTAYQLPRNTSHAKLKKNLSHGQLTRLSSGRNLAALGSTTHKAPPSPGLRGKSRRSKSAEMAVPDKEEYDVESEVHEQQPDTTSRKRVGFAVGSPGDSSDEENVKMEGSGMQEDEWTEGSASASPYSTRQNTANNSRRASDITDITHKAAEKLHFAGAVRPQETNRTGERAGFAQLQPTVSRIAESPNTPSTSAPAQSSTPQPEQESAEPVPVEVDMLDTSKRVELAQRNKTPQRSPLHQAKEHPNPATRRLLEPGHQLPAPALISNVSAMDDTHSSRDSSAPSQSSLRSNLEESATDQQEDELVSRFVPSASHPSVGSGPTTAVGTPKQIHFHTPDEDSTLAAHHRHHDRSMTGFSIGPTSPGSTISNSSGTTTPAMMGRSRTELRMLQEKAMADLEFAATHRPQLPAHVYDRRNESLKSYMNIHALGGVGGGGEGGRTRPDVFQGRFRALNTELRVVQKFRDPVAESLSRLRRTLKTPRAESRRREGQALGGNSTTSEIVHKLWQIA